MNQELLDKLYVARSLYACWISNRNTSKALTEKYDEANEIVNSRHYEEEIPPHDHATDLHTGILAKVFGPIALFVFVACGVVQCAHGSITGEAAKGTYKGLIPGWIVMTIVGSILVLGVLAIIIDIIVHLISKAKARKWNEKIDKDFKEYNEEEKAKYDSETAQFKAKALDVKKRCDKYNENEKIAGKAYKNYLATGFVYSSYQSIVPICQFIQYLESGRCERLEGPDGCYNLYESELRQNVIISELDRIRSSIERIENNQIVMARTLMSIETTTKELLKAANEMSNDTYEIAANTRAIMACSEIAADAARDAATAARDTATATSELRRELSYYG